MKGEVKQGYVVLSAHMRLTHAKRWTVSDPAWIWYASEVEKIIVAGQEWDVPPQYIVEATFKPGIGVEFTGDPVPVAMWTPRKKT